MSKHAISRKQNQETSVGGQRTLHLASVIQRDLHAFIIEEGMKVLQEVLRQDQEALCGPAYSRGTPGGPQRWGRTSGRLVMSGRRVVIDKPRVRQNGHEVKLPTWEEFADEDPLNERTTEQMILGVSTRDYDRSVDAVPEELSPHGASKSAASRRFVEQTRQRLEQWQKRDISKMHIVAVMLDAIEVDEHAVVVALGIDQAGGKHALGLWLGATENATVCGALLDNLIERGLNSQLSYLFVIDGSKALRQAIRERFGRRALVQRCQEHKRRNVLSHVPERLHPSIAKTMRDAYQSKSRAMAKRRLLQLASQLRSDHPDAAESLREGLDETLTLKDMGLPSALERTLSTTNSIENVNSNIRRTLRRIKRWRDGSMIKRWVAVALMEAERGFRRLRGFKGMPVLVAAVRCTEQKHRVDSRQEAA